MEGRNVRVFLQLDYLTLSFWCLDKDDPLHGRHVAFVYTIRYEDGQTVFTLKHRHSLKDGMVHVRHHDSQCILYCPDNGGNGAMAGLCLASYGPQGELKPPVVLSDSQWIVSKIEVTADNTVIYYQGEAG